MRVFVTGANGFIGQSTVKELLKHNHQVVGLARSDSAAETLSKAGAEVLRGDLDDLEALARGAKSSDGVIHLAFRHDLMATDIGKALEIDRAAIKAMGDAMIDSNKPLAIASGTLMLKGGQLATEDSEVNRTPPFGDRALSADLVEDYSKKGVRGSVVRLTPTVHGAGDGGFVPMVIGASRGNGAVLCVGDGRWPAVHRDDAAVLFRLVMEKGTPGATYHAVAEEGISWKEIGRLIGDKLKLPVENVSVEEAYSKLGFLAHPLSQDNSTSSEKTRKALGWEPQQPGLLADMEAHYFS